MIAPKPNGDNPGIRPISWVRNGTLGVRRGYHDLRYIIAHGTALLTPLRCSSTTWRLNSLLNFLRCVMARSFLSVSGISGPARSSNTLCPTHGVQSTLNCIPSINLAHLRPLESKSKKLLRHLEAENPGYFGQTAIPSQVLGIIPGVQGLGAFSSVSCLSV